MTQPSDIDFSQPNAASGTSMRTNINDYFQGILTKLSGTTAPTTTVANMWWIDTSATPPELNIRNNANTAWIKVAELDTSDVKLFSENGEVIGLGNTSAFTQSQIIDRTGAAGSITIRSNQTTGIAASVDLAGHDDAANDTVYASIDCEITDDTNTSEDGQIVFRVIQAGSEVARMTVGATVAVTGTLNATVIQQNGTTLDSIIETAAGNMGNDDTSATTRTVPNDITRGERNRFTGSSASTWTINSGTAGDVYPVRNRGTASITFTAGTATIVGGTTLAQDKVCTIEYDSATTVLIYGENV